jgi:hypothetical protein
MSSETVQTTTSDGPWPMLPMADIPPIDPLERWTPDAWRSQPWSEDWCREQQCRARQHRTSFFEGRYACVGGDLTLFDGVPPTCPGCGHVFSLAHARAAFARLVPALQAYAGATEDYPAPYETTVESTLTDEICGCGVWSDWALAWSLLLGEAKPTEVLVGLRLVRAARADRTIVT